jgi:hypothetical protein
MVFQSYALYPHMSVEENIGFGLRMNGMIKSDVRSKVTEAASILHVSLLRVKLGWYHFRAGWQWWSDDIPADFSKAGELARAVLAKEDLSPQVKRLAHRLFAKVLIPESNFTRALKEADMAISLAPYDAGMIGDLERTCPSCPASQTKAWNGFARRLQAGHHLWRRSAQ